MNTRFFFALAAFLNQAAFGDGEGLFSLVNREDTGEMGSRPFPPRLARGQGRRGLQGQKRTAGNGGCRTGKTHGLARARISLRDGDFACPNAGIPQPEGLLCFHIHKANEFAVFMLQGNFLDFGYEKTAGGYPAAIEDVWGR